MAEQNEMAAQLADTGAVAVKPKKPRKKRSVKKMIFLGVVALLAGWLVISQVIAALRGPLPTPVSAQTVAQGSIAQQLSTSGTVISGNKVTVYAPVSAKATAVLARMGDRVKAGDPLVTYDTTELERAYKTASAAAAAGGLQKQDSLTASDNAQKAFNDASANLQNAAVQKDAASARVQALAAQYAGFADQTTAEALEVKTQLDAAAQDLEAVTGALSSAKAGYDAAKAGVMTDNQKKQLDYGQVASQMSLTGAKEDLAAGKAGVSAPISGVITSLSADMGAVTGQNSPICVIEGLDDVRIDIALSRYDLEKVRVGQTATITILGKSYTGKVETINAVATQTASSTGTASYVHAQIKLDAPDDTLVLGIEAAVTISTGSAENVLTVPLEAVNTDVNGQFCYVIEDGTAVRRTVTLGLSGDTSAEVTSGLSAGDQVITTPDMVLAEGQKVSADAAMAAQSGAPAGMAATMAVG